MTVAPKTYGPHCRQEPTFLLQRPDLFWMQPLRHFCCPMHGLVFMVFLCCCCLCLLPDTSDVQRAGMSAPPATRLSTGLVDGQQCPKIETDTAKYTKLTVAEIEFKLQYNPFSVYDIQVSAAKALQASRFYGCWCEPELANIRQKSASSCFLKILGLEVMTTTLLHYLWNAGQNRSNIAWDSLKQSQNIPCQQWKASGRALFIQNQNLWLLITLQMIQFLSGVEGSAKCSLEFCSGWKLLSRIFESERSVLAENKLLPPVITFV